MFKKFLVTAMVFCICIVQANAATHNNLKTAFDELNYSLSVEWDQSDRAFYSKAQDKFATSLKDLQAKGLTNSELVSFVVSQVQDQKLAKELETAFNMVMITKMTSAEAHKYVTDVMNKSYSRGASWNGGGAIAGVLVLVIIVAVVLVANGNVRADDNCVEVRQCDDYCSAGVCYEDCYYECI